MILIFPILCASLHASRVDSEDVSIRLDALREEAREKVEALRHDHTLKRSPRLEHPIANRPLHQFLLDRPDVGAAIARSLGIGKYTVTRVGKDRFHGSDGEGAEGDLEILYRDEGYRAYYTEGFAKGAILTVRGKALVLQQSRYRTTEQGQKWVQTQLTIYAKITNPFLAFLLKIFSLFMGDLVDAKISKAQRVIQQVSEAIVHDPRETYWLIEESGELVSKDLNTLRKLMNLPEPSTPGLLERSKGHDHRREREVDPAESDRKLSGVASICGILPS